MADAKPAASGGGDSGAGIIFLMILILIILWLMQGAKRASWAQLSQSPIATSSTHQWLPFWNGTSTANTGSGAGTGSDSGIQGTIQNAGAEISISSNSGVYSSDPRGEYLVLYAYQTNTAPISISGWQLRSRNTGRTATIGGGIETMLTGQPATPTEIILKPGSSAVISTGSSPIGVSFMENKCSGYLSQFQTFIPQISNRCPYPMNELATRLDLANDQQCSYTTSVIPPCRAFIQPPRGVTYDCSNFLQQRLTYNGCVTAHRNDPDFTTGAQWRVFLGQSSKLWSNSSDRIDLINMQGKIVSTVIY